MDKIQIINFFSWKSENTSSRMSLQFCIIIIFLLNDPFPIFRELLDSSQHQSYLTDVFQSKLLHLHISETLWYRLAKNICRGTHCKNKCVTKLQLSWRLQKCFYCRSHCIIKIDLQSYTTWLQAQMFRLPLLELKLKSLE